MTTYKVFTRTPAAMRILAIDPGYDRLGIAVVEGDASRPTLIMSDCVQPPKGAAHERLATVSRVVSEAITLYQPDALGVETLFFSINKKTALGVAEARGAILAAAGLATLPVIECTPQAVKLAITGHGGADKKAIALMVPKLLALPAKKRLDDELDAIAVGITALATGLKSTPS
jgi:crossover junction endodeoxyribonuclease RuvC